MSPAVRADQQSPATPVEPSDAGTTIAYLVDLRARVQHLVTVTMQVPPEVVRAGGRLVVPTWTPGSYVVRDYIHHLQSMTVRTSDGTGLLLEADSISSWHIPPMDAGLTITFEWYAFESTVRTNHVDESRALLVGAATFPTIEQARSKPHSVRFLDDPSTGEVVSLLPGEGNGPYVASDHAELMDSAFATGATRSASIAVRGVEHRIIWAGHGAGTEVSGLAHDLGLIAAAAADVFDGSIPTARYTVIAVDGEGGGLEHRDGCVVAFPVHATSDPNRRRRIVGLLAHEYFHLCNVRRLTPAALVDPPLDRPALSPSLWIAEGWTSYYDRVLPARAGLTTVPELLEGLDALFNALEQMPGVQRQSLHDASRTAWTKHYRRDENSPNAGTDYYAHGAALAFELDLALRQRQDGSSLDAVLRELWRRHGGGIGPDRTGYTEADVLDVLAAVGGQEIAERCRAGTTRPGWTRPDALLSSIGLRSVPHPQGAAPELGLILASDGARVGIRSVLRDGPAWEAGVSGGDQLLAIDGETLRADELEPVLRRHGPGQDVRLTLVRGPRTLECQVRLGPPRTRLILAADPTASRAARREFRRWSGLEFPTLHADAQAPEDSDVQAPDAVDQACTTTP